MAMPRTPFADSRMQFRAGAFGIAVFLGSLGMLFAATLLAFFIVRLEIGRGWPDLPPLPRILWGSTLTILFSSAALQRGLIWIRRGQADMLKRYLLVTLALGVLFLMLQTVAWLQWLPQAAQRWRESEEAGLRFALTSFYVLTILHALHVIGGLIPMAVVATRAVRRRYSAAQHSGVQYMAMYWHFLGAVWLVLFASLMLVG